MALASCTPTHTVGTSLEGYDLAAAAEDNTTFGENFVAYLPEDGGEKTASCAALASWLGTEGTARGFSFEAGPLFTVAVRVEGEDPDPQEQEGPATEDKVPDGAEPFSFDRADSEGRQAAVETSLVTSAQATKLAVAAERSSEQRVVAAEGELARFCWIGGSDDLGRSAEEYAFLVEELRELGVEVDRERIVVTPAADPVDAGARGTADAFFRARDLEATDGEVGVLKLGSGGSPVNGKVVRIGFLDTHPTSRTIFGAAASSSPSSNHGMALASSASVLLCSPYVGTSNCPVSVGTRLALGDKLDADGKRRRSTDKGGHFGSELDLATAIRDEVAAHRVEIDSDVIHVDEGHALLILNLSVGWNPVHSVHAWEDANGKDWNTEVAGGKDLSWDTLAPWLADYPSLPVSTRAVLAALADARCRGALPIAAAGNRSHGGNQFPDAGGSGDSWSEGPILPAAWMHTAFNGTPAAMGAGQELRFERGRIPACKAFEVDVGEEDTVWDGGNPVVYAISGYGPAGGRLPVARDAGHSPLSAYGERGLPTPPSTAKKALGYDDLPIMTGTSVSAAVVSSAAAVEHLGRVASDRLGKPGEDYAASLMSGLYKGAPALADQDGGSGNEEADFASAHFGQDVHAITLCSGSSLKAANLSCTQPAYTRQRPTDTLSHTQEVTGASVSPDVCVSDDHQSLDSIDQLVAAGGWLVASAANPVPSAAPGLAQCIQRTFPSRDVLGGVWPQPPTVPCPPCHLDILPKPDTFQVALYNVDWNMGTYGVTQFVQAHLEIRYNDGGIVNLPFSLANFEFPGAVGQTDVPPNLVEIAQVKTSNIQSVTIIRLAEMDDGALLAYDTPLRMLPPR